MKLKQVLSNLNEFKVNSDLLSREITNITIDPQKATNETLFVSLKNDDKAKQIMFEATEKGAVILCEDSMGVDDCVVVKDVRSAYALVSKALYKNVCDKLKMVAVTGTNGKTTTTKIIADILRLNGKKVGLIGTLGVSTGKEMKETGFTTPDPEILHKTLFEMKKKGVEYVVMEASAHALALKKLDGIKFEASVFTNLTQDHLDFFGDMESYLKAKKLLFSSEKTKVGIVYSGDEFARKLMNEVYLPILTYNDKETADCCAKNIVSTSDGSSFECKLFYNDFLVNSQFVGDYNIQNILGAMLTARFLGITTENIKKSVAKISPAEGRFNKINFNGKTIIVDFAHTPDGLEKVLKTAREITENKLICIFGCGGNRDKTKRPIMGKISEELCDEVIVTSDNPRFEEPLEIIDDITDGMVKNNYTVLIKREDAIYYGLKHLREGDTLVIAGKGGEKYQDIDGIKHPYDDFKVIEESINAILKEKEKKNAN